MRRALRALTEGIAGFAIVAIATAILLLSLSN
jgi:hypothetical protein